MNTEKILSILKDCLTHAQNAETRAYSRARQTREFCEGRRVEWQQCEAFEKQKATLAEQAKATHETLLSYFTSEGEPEELRPQLARLENAWKEAEATRQEFAARCANLRARYDEAAAPIAGAEAEVKHLTAERVRIERRIGELNQQLVRAHNDRLQAGVRKADEAEARVSY